MPAAMEEKPKPAAEPDSHGVAQDINWGDYRDHLTTADKDGEAVRVALGAKNHFAHRV